MSKKINIGLLATIMILNIAMIYKFSIFQSKVENEINVLRYDVIRTQTKLESTDENIKIANSSLSKESSNNEKKESSVFSNYKVDFKEINSASSEITTTITLTPKEMTNNMNIKFITKSDTGKSEIYVMNRIENEFVSNISIPLAKSKNLEFIYTLTYDNMVKTETVKSINDIKWNFLLSFNGGYEGRNSFNKDLILYDGNINIKYKNPEKTSFVKGSVYALLGDEIIFEKDLVKNEKKELTCEFKKEFITNGKNLYVFAEFQDSNGLIYVYNIDYQGGFEGKNKGIAPPVGYANEIREIKDALGNMVYTNGSKNVDFLKIN